MLKNTISLASMFCLFLLVAFSFTSCMQQSMASSRMTVESGSIPPNFGKEETVLLAVTYNKPSYDNYLKKHVTELYKGAYVFVDKEALNDPQYSDAQKYRYIFDYDLKTSGHGADKTYAYDFYVIDRAEDKKYDAKFTSSFFSKLIQAYMVNLENQRLAMAQPKG